MAIALSSSQITSKLCQLSVINKGTSTDLLQKENGENMERFSVFSRQQKRNMKFLLLKASRPLLKRSVNQDKTQSSVEAESSRRKTKSQKSPGSSVEFLDVEKSEQLLPLHALQMFEEANRAEQLQSRSKSSPGPLNSAINAVDWVLDMAQGVSIPPYDWPVFGWMKEEAEFIQSPKQFLEASLKVNAPHCSWPRTLSTSTASTSSTSLTPDPHCAWPRHTATQASKSSVTSTSSSVSGGDAALQFSAFAPRCEWPKVGKTLSSARCDWPRKASDAPLSVEMPIAAFGPRCNWPQKSLARFSHEQAADNIELAFVEETKQEEGTVIEGGARCPWPRISAKASTFEI